MQISISNTYFRTSSSPRRETPTEGQSISRDTHASVPHNAKLQVFPSGSAEVVLHQHILLELIAGLWQFRATH